MDSRRRPSLPLVSSCLAIALAALTGPAPALAGGAAPGWTKRQEHAAYPSAKFLVGVGSAAYSGDPAKDTAKAEAAARADLLAQISVSVKNETASFEQEVTKGGKAFDASEFSSRTQQSVAGTLEGARIVETWNDEDGDERWALCVLEKAQAAAGLKSSVEAAGASVREATSKAAGAATADAALRALVDALGDAEKAEANAVLYRALTRESLTPVRTGEVRDAIAALASALVVEVRGGDRQPASAGQPLGEPVVFAVRSGTRAFADLPLRVSLDGPGKVQAMAKTGADGTASVRVSEVQSSGAPEQHVVAEADWAAWLRERGSRRRADELGLGAASGRAAYLFKTVATTRIAIAIEEKVVWQNAEKTEAPASPVVTPKLGAALSAAGFDVRPAGALGGLTAAQVAAASPAELKAKLSAEAEVVVTGTLTSEFASRMCPKCPTFHVAKGTLRAVDTRTGQLVATFDEPGKKAVGPSETAAGQKALEEASKSVVPGMVGALGQALKR